MAVDQADDAVHATGEGVVVGGDEGAQFLVAGERQQLIEDDVRRRLVEVPGRLVRQQQGRAVGDGAGDGDALPLGRPTSGRDGGSPASATRGGPAAPPRGAGRRRCPGRRCEAAASRSRSRKIPAAGDGTGRRSRCIRGGSGCGWHRRYRRRRGRRSGSRPRRAAPAGRRYAAGSICRRRTARPGDDLARRHLQPGAPQDLDPVVALHEGAVDALEGERRRRHRLTRTGALRRDRGWRPARRDRSSPGTTAPVP